MGRCDTKLAQDILLDCDNISQKGVESEGVIINYADIDKAGCTRSGNILSALALVNGAKGYKIVVPEGSPFNGTMIEAAVGTYMTKWNKTVAFVVLNSGPDVSHDVIDKLANGKFVAILQNKFAGEDGKNSFEVYGFEQGLKLSAGARDLNSDDTDGGWSVTLQEQQAPSSGLFLFDTDLATTKTLISTLTAAASSPG
jgi:hypothetical protein